jgi:hypothetical protein
MKNESKKLIGFFALMISIISLYSNTFAQSYTIVPNPNNQAFFGSSAYARNYYKELGYYTYENNPAAACYGLQSCYSVNYYYPKNIGYNYQNNNSNYNYIPNSYYQYPNQNYNYNYNYNSYGNYYPYQNQVNVQSVPQIYWSR